MTFHCKKCREYLAGDKPKKSKNVCIGCINDWYNKNKQGCWSYNNFKIKIKNVYHSKNQIVPDPEWRFECFVKEY